jgi:hypothetical protein
MLMRKRDHHDAVGKLPVDDFVWEATQQGSTRVPLVWGTSLRDLRDQLDRSCEIIIESGSQAGSLLIVVLDGIQDLPQRRAEESDLHLAASWACI